MDQPGPHVPLRGNQPAAADRMRELLARTVQDHVFDQRSNAGALEDIRQRMEGLEWLVKEVREREVAGLTAQLDDLGKRLDESTQKPPQLQSVCDTVGQAVAALQAQDDRLGMVDGKVGTLAGRLDGLDGRLEGVGARIDGLGSTFGDRFGQLDGKLDTATGRFTDVGGQLEKLDRGLAAVGRLVDTTAEQLNSQLEPLADELRSRPGHTDVQEILAKIVDAAQSDVTTQLGSLEETVLTLAEALLRPQGQPGGRPEPRSVPAPRDGAEPLRAEV